MRLPRHRGVWLALIVILSLASAARAAETPVYVILWFDTEDYIMPASDDAALKLADWLTQEGIRATFKVVGEKARTLERRKRNDVIAALKKHEIGYHSNYHSVQPSPALYLSNLGWDDGVAEFDRRERPGFDDVKRIFGQSPSCYGQPGSSWGPQAYGAMRKWGMQVYLDVGLNVRLDDKPCYYCGALNLYKLAYVLRTKLDGYKNLEEAEAKFLEARGNLHGEGGGIVSIYYHPCEFVHKEFWDAANFAAGANPPRERWKLPAARTAEESKGAFDNFTGYIRFMKRFPDVRFITASEAASLYGDAARGHKFTPADLANLALGVTDEVTFQKHGEWALSASEVFALLNEYVAEKSAGRTPAALECKSTPFGPSSPVRSLVEPVTTDWSQFTRTSVDVADYVRKQGRIPSSVWLGSTPVPPESYLVALGRVTRDLLEGKTPPATVELRPARLAAAAYVADDDPKLWTWPIFPPGFKAPAMMELAKRQSWTLKPAMLGRLEK